MRKEARELCGMGKCDLFNIGKNVGYVVLGKCGLFSIGKNVGYANVICLVSAKRWAILYGHSCELFCIGRG